MRLLLSFRDQRSQGQTSNPSIPSRGLTRMTRIPILPECVSVHLPLMLNCPLLKKQHLFPYLNSEACWKMLLLLKLPNLNEGTFPWSEPTGGLWNSLSGKWQWCLAGLETSSFQKCGLRWYACKVFIHNRRQKLLALLETVRLVCEI